MKLKDILEENIGGIVPMESIGGPKDSASLLKIAKELVAKEEDEKLMTREALIEKVSNFSSYGPSIYKKHNLAEVAETFVEISKAAQKHVVEETADWFDRVTVQRNMNDLKKQAAGFSKIATEAQALQDRMAALYEDMGQILNRYFEINEFNEDNINEKYNPRRADLIHAIEDMQDSGNLSGVAWVKKHAKDNNTIPDTVNMFLDKYKLRKYVYDGVSIS